MEFLKVTAKDNKLIKKIKKLVSSASYRREENAFVLEGLRLVLDAAKNGYAIETLVVSESFLEANADLKVAEAKAQEVQMVYGAMMKANPDERVVQLKSLETLKDVANGDANKVFIPYEATGMLGSIGSIKDMFEKK